MRKLLALALLPGLALAAAPASAALYSTSFSGTGAGGTATGSFTYNSDTNTFLNFTVGTNSLAAPTAGSVTVVPAGTSNPYEALYQVPATGFPHFTLDLEALSLSGFPTGNALTLLATPSLISLLDTNPGDSPFNSTFSYCASAATAAVTYNLTSISTRVPEPASLALLAAPVFGLAIRRRR